MEEKVYHYSKCMVNKEEGVCDMNVTLLVSIIMGLMIGILLVFVLLIITKKDGNIKCKYDERQTAVRGKAYKISFFLLLIYNILYGLCSTVIEKMPIDSLTVMFIGIIIALAFHVTYCIWKDAYFSLNEDKRKLMIVFILIAILNLAIGIGNLVSGYIIVDGVLTYHCVNLLCSILFVLLFLVLLVKNSSKDSQSE